MHQPTNSTLPQPSLKSATPISSQVPTFWHLPVFWPHFHCACAKTLRFSSFCTGIIFTKFESISFWLSFCCWLIRSIRSAFFYCFILLFLFWLIAVVLSNGTVFSVSDKYESVNERTLYRSTKNKIPYFMGRAGSADELITIIRQSANS